MTARTVGFLCFFLGAMSGMAFTNVYWMSRKDEKITIGEMGKLLRLSHHCRMVRAALGRDADDFGSSNETTLSEVAHRFYVAALHSPQEIELCTTDDLQLGQRDMLLMFGDYDGLRKLAGKAANSIKP